MSGSSTVEMVQLFRGYEDDGRDAERTRVREGVCDSLLAPVINLLSKIRSPPIDCFWQREKQSMHSQQKLPSSNHSPNQRRS